MFDLFQHDTIYWWHQISLEKPEYSNNLMLINFLISWITKRFLRSFDRHTDTTLTLSELFPNINKFRDKKDWNFFRKFHECGFWIVRVIVNMSWIPLNFFKKCPPVNSYRFSSSTDRRTESTFLYSLHPGDVSYCYTWQ